MLQYWRLSLALVLLFANVLVAQVYPANSSAETTSPLPAPIISRNAPAFASSEAGNVAYNADDDDYGTFWRSVGTPAWLAYDLSSVPAAHRGRVLVAWYNDPITPDYDPLMIKVAAYNLPRDYTIEGNRAAGGDVPSGGWEILTSVTDNSYHSRQHSLDLSGYNWIRMNVMAGRGSPQANDIALNLDVHDASRGPQDDWIFFGDYLTAAGLDHAPRGVGTFGQIINSCLPERFPVQESGGTSFLQSSDGATALATYLRLFPGQFVALSFGTTDASFYPAGDPSLPDKFYNNYVTMVRAVQAAGKTPVIPTVPWARKDNAQANILNLNMKIAALYSAFPQIVQGPDLYTFFKAHQDLISSDDLTPTAAGFAALRYQWAGNAVQTIYGGHMSSAPNSEHSIDVRFFPETGMCIHQPFLNYWQDHSSIALLGLPIGSETTETLEDGRPYSVQYFERARLEYHPENFDPRYQILLGQLGRIIHSADPPVQQLPSATYFPESGHNLGSDFRHYWESNGGLAQFGFPITEEFTETLEDGKSYTVQYFERARFEYHPENQAPYNVLLGQVGRRVLARR